MGLRRGGSLAVLKKEEQHGYNCSGPAGFGRAREVGLAVSASVV